MLKRNKDRQLMDSLLKETQRRDPKPNNPIIMVGKAEREEQGASRPLPDRFFDFEEPLDDLLGFFIRWYFRASSLSGAAVFPGAGGCVLERDNHRGTGQLLHGALWKRGTEESHRAGPFEDTGESCGVPDVHTGSSAPGCRLLLEGRRPTESSSSRRPTSDGNGPGAQSEDLGKGERDFNSRPATQNSSREEEGRRRKQLQRLKFLEIITIKTFK